MSLWAYKYFQMTFRMVRWAVVVERGSPPIVGSSEGSELGEFCLITIGCVPTQLYRDKTGERAIEGRLPSPRVAERFPGNPYAKARRFKVAGVQMEKDNPVKLWANFSDGEQRMLAAISR
jgi:hypothetical protein